MLLLLLLLLVCVSRLAKTVVEKMNSCHPTGSFLVLSADELEGKSASFAMVYFVRV